MPPGNDDEFKLPDDVHEHVAEQLIGKSWEEVEVLEHAGYLLFPEKLHRRTKDGTFESQDVCLRIPREHELRRARVEARRIAMEDGLDLDRDRDLVETIECVCVLSVAIRNRTDPHEPWEPDPRMLERKWDRGSITQLWAKLDEYSKVVDPRPETISPEELLAVMARMVKERAIHPLHAYGPAAQSSCIVTMAGLSLIYLESKSSSELSELLTPGSSDRSS